MSYPMQQPYMGGGHNEQQQVQLQPIQPIHLSNSGASGPDTTTHPQAPPYNNGNTQNSGGQNGGSNASSEIASWVEQNFTATTVGGVTVYDLSASA